MNLPYHIEFLGNFPTLRDWLSMNGFSMVYSTRSFETDTVISMWSDSSTADSNKHFAPDASNALMIVYCTKCRTLEVYGRGFLGVKGEDGEIGEIMKGLVRETVVEKVEEMMNGGGEK